MYVCTYVCTYVRMYVGMYVCMYVQVGTVHASINTEYVAVRLKCMK